MDTGIGGTAQALLNRRSLLRYGMGVGAAATVTPVLSAVPAAAEAPSRGRVLPAPRPIPGGTQIPDGPLIHVFAPGPTDVTLPRTGFRLQGLDVEPNVMTDFRGVTAVAFHVGTARDQDGNEYLLETDMRAVTGTYVAEDGTRRRGAFAFV